MNLRTYLLILSLSIISGCSGAAQNGNAQYAMEMLVKCNFQQALEASNEALSFGQADEKAFVASAAIKAKVHELLGQELEANKAYLLLVEHSNNITSIEQAKLTTKTLEPLIESCGAKS